MANCSDYESFSSFRDAGASLTDAVTCFFQRAPLPAEQVGHSLWMIIALPLLGAFICGVFGKSLGRQNVHLVACGSVLGSFALSILTFWTAADGFSGVLNPYSNDVVRYAVGADYGTWFSAGSFRVNFGLYADHLSGTMLLVITGVGFLIHLYSTEYMAHEDGYWRFFAYLNLFVGAMLTLVLADSLVLLFVGWEGVGMCSYLLIGYYYDDAAKAYAGRKAFITNRVGDFGFLVASFLLVLTVSAFENQARAESFHNRSGLPGAISRVVYATGVRSHGPLAFGALEEMARTMPNELDTEIDAGPLKGHTFGNVLTVILLCFLLGAAGKSAQLPLYVWLPDAMAGPTPVSALIHAATMVTAGIYLFCRLSYLVVLSPTAMATIAVIGGLTALIAALIAFSQDDLKKVLAYSTVSQLGMMFMAVGAGMFWAAFLHVITHAFFKACLFLGAGSVMHGNADEGNIRKLGGLRKEMKVTWVTFSVATLAITGIVPLSGFFSKDAILHALHTTEIEHYPHVLHYVWFMGLATALCTAFYMTRLYVMTFEGKRASDARIPHAHESGPAVLFVLSVLAILSVVALVHGIPFMHNSNGGPDQTLMENFLAPVFDTARSINHNYVHTFKVEEHHGLPWGAWGLAWVIALIGGSASVFAYTRYFPAMAAAGKPVPAVLKALQKVTANKFYVDELYELIIIKPIKFISMVFFRVIDSVLIDTVAVKGTGWVTTRAGSLLRYVQSGDAQSYAAVMAVALAGCLAWAVFS